MTTSLAGFVLGVCLVLGAVGPAAADKVGVAAAVNPDAFSSLAGSPQSQLNIGKSIFYNERINTTGSGLVQVLLVDGSTFTVGPGSDLVIDKFVYDPKKGVGQISASFSKGVMRFVGGKISKNEGGVTVDTPAGALAIRGCIVQGTPSKMSFLFGVSMTWKGNNGQTATVYEPGYTLDLTGGTPNVRPTTAADTNSLMAALTNSNTGGLSNSSEPQGGNQPQVVDTLSLQDLVADATAEKVDENIIKDETGAPAASDPTEPTEPTEPTGPTQVTARVLVGAGVYTAFPGTADQFTTDEGADAGILGGDPNATVDDFEWTFNIENNRLVGTVSGLTDAHCMNGDCSPDNIVTSTPPPVDVNLPATFPVAQCALGVVCPVLDATLTQDGETTTYEGLLVLTTDFFAYHLVNAPEEGDDDYHPEPFLAFGGKGHDFGTPSGKTYAFLLTADPKEALNGGAIGPFAGGGSSPDVNKNGPQPAISPLLYLEKDSAASSDPSRAVWLQTSLYINTTPGNGDNIEFDQQSWVNVALGGVQDGGLVGARRGGAAVDFYQEGQGSCGGPCPGYTSREAFAFTGDIASLAGPDGSHFLGKDDPNIVIGFDSTGTHNIGRDIPLTPIDTSEGAPPASEQVENQSGSTYHIGVGIGTLPPQDQTLNGELKGYAVGMVQSAVPDNDFANVVASRSPDDFGITFDNTRNTLSASLNVYDIQHTDSATGRYTLGFGDNPQSPANKSAYIDDLHYAAIENGANQVSNWDDGEFTPYESTAATSYLVSGEQLNATSFFPDTFEADDNGYRPFCTNCEFMQWGAWGTRVTFGNDSENPYVDNVHLGWWVAGDIATSGDEAADLDKLAALDATATYSGHAIGNVANSLSQDGWKTYVATGDLEMTWGFQDRIGDLTISRFDTANFGADGLSFTGAMCAPGVTCGTGNFSGVNVAAGNHFGGSLSGEHGNIGSLSGSAAGSFVNNGPNNPAAGVIGNWNVGGDGYKATGVFAGSGTPTH